mmetsp:Transcript_27021/g.59096  ORF Transcript_27021/g.59096 Transcript_27021/m.59096 type:complete len:635 (+) Transcript_27021:187-2091(+)|eukprot:CAMPEP_0202913540 /NCGR_PEP_ID=MMETSP1392-20130828/60747_1 /ASSEMBLY_ACC=CAM_ASM_000868 /TAXON_ID=225041 /ORGANISM="Chlamydomonas chlamydogama, Strain SAG 11-48b" /LENGTH=634 /DNA_ID=CAMNT_0049604833 /DNA_START=142 /DNA_END=2049 /DNA_ORIENTATION=+
MRTTGYGRTTPAKGRASYVKLLAIAGFSGGLLFGYLFLSGPSTDHSVHHASTQIMHLNHGSHLGSRKELTATLHSDLAAHHGTAQAPAAPEVTSVARPPPHVTVNENDQRHPHNVKQMIAQGSSQDEQKSAQVEALKQQQSDTGDSSEAHKASTAGAHSSKTSAASTKPPTRLKSKSSSSQHTGTTAHGSASAGASYAGSTTTSSTTGQQHALSSGVASTAASLQKATEELKKVTASLETKKAAAAVGASKASGAQKAGTSAQKADAGSKAPTADLLAYSKSQKQPGDTIHVLFTSNGSPYQNFQARIMVGTYNIVRKQPGGEKLVAMTRILHRTTPDELMDEIPTFRAQPLQPECDKWCWFPVADRANAMQQWIDAVQRDPSLIKAPWILLLETDYVWIKPLQALGSAYDPEVPGLSYAFDYIAPQNPIVQEILKDKCPTCDPKSVPNSGPAPVLMRFSDLRAATPLWEELSQWIETHEHAKKQLGWVREMYAWDIGVAANQLNILNKGYPASTLISQPPHDSGTGNATMYHYTWGAIIKDDAGKEFWKFDKRFYTDPKDALKVPRIPVPPTCSREGLKVQDGTPFSKQLCETMTDMINHMNEAIDTLPDLTAEAAQQQAGAATTTSAAATAA